MTWVVPKTPVELRRQAKKLQLLAAHVRELSVARQLQENAAELLAEAELRRRKDAE